MTPHICGLEVLNLFSPFGFPLNPPEKGVPSQKKTDPSAKAGHRSHPVPLRLCGLVAGRHLAGVSRTRETLEDMGRVPFFLELVPRGLFVFGRGGGVLG